MIKQSEVSIIIPHLGGSKEQRRAYNECINSLWETVPDIKIITAFNGLNREPSAKTNESYIALSEQGQCKAVNAAVATTNTPWIFITNDDMIYPPGWFEKLVDLIRPRYLVDNKELQDIDFRPGGVILADDVNSVKKLDDILCISPMLVEPRDGAPTFMVQPFGGAGGDFDKQKWLEFAKNYKGQGLRTGFNFPVLIKRELWDLIGGYDINYDPWGSNGDSDLEYKIKLAGVQPIQSQNSIVYHFSQTSGTFKPMYDGFRFRNYAYFKAKWGFDRTDDGIWEATFEIPDEGRIFRPKWENQYR